MTPSEALYFQAFTSTYAGPAENRRLLSVFSPFLNAALGGGLPCGGITEIYGRLSSGKTSLAHVLIAAVVRQREWAAWIDLPNTFDPECARNAGIDLDRVLWIAPADHVTAVRAVEHVLDAGGFRMVVLDLGNSSSTKPRLSASVWLRVNRAAVIRRAAIVVLDAVHTMGTFAMLSLEACASRRVFAGEGGPCPLFEGAASSLHVRKIKCASPSGRPLKLFATTKG